MYCCYIIYSPEIDRFYIGETDDIERRLKEHKNNSLSKFTKQVNDWELFLLIPAKSRHHARRIELFIKRMKSKRFIISLKEDSEKLNSIVEKCLVDS